MLEVIKDEALHLPVAVVREWQNHSQVGPDFQAFLDKFVEMGYKLIDPEEEAKKKREEEDRKRGAGEGGGGPQPSPKRARVAEALDSSFIIPGAEISSPLIQEIKLGANWPTVHCRGENTFYLVNGTENSFSQVDACIAFFGSGSYKIIKDNQDMPPKAVIYSLESSKDMVVLNGVMSPLMWFHHSGSESQTANCATLTCCLLEMMYPNSPVNANKKSCSFRRQRLLRKELLWQNTMVLGCSPGGKNPHA